MTWFLAGPRVKWKFSGAVHGRNLGLMPFLTSRTSDTETGTQVCWVWYGIVEFNVPLDTV